MNRINNPLPSQTESDLKRLVEPLASYIAATAAQRIAVVAAMVLLLDHLEQINDDANRQFNSISKNHVI
jgi:hypothetical protein